MKKRIKQLERQAKRRQFEYLSPLDADEFVTEYLRTLEFDYGYISRELIEMFIANDDGELEDWQEIIDKVLADKCEPIGGKNARRWRMKPDESS